MDPIPILLEISSLTFIDTEKCQKVVGIFDEFSVGNKSSNKITNN